MRPTCAAILAGVLTVVLGGCGTVVNCVSVNGAAARTIYGGVRQDAANGTRHLAEAFTGPAPSFSKMPQPPNAARDLTSKSFCAVCGVGMLAVDLPVSAVADTLTLPVTVPSTLMKKSSNPKRKRRPKVMGMPSAAVPPSRPSNP
jgi:uncharacterized protein YceK